MRHIDYKNILIHLLYIIPLIVFIYALVKNLKDLNQISSIGIKYSYVFIIPILIFAYQTLRNSIIGWIAVMLLYLIYLILLIVGLIQTYELIGTKFTYNQFFINSILAIVYLGIGLLYYRFRPKNRII
jgi:hypothetical protein